MAIVMSNEPIVGIGARTSPRAAALAKWLGLGLALLAYWFDWPSWVLISSIAALSYGIGASDGYRWARKQRWMEWMAENVDNGATKLTDNGLIVSSERRQHAGRAEVLFYVGEPVEQRVFLCARRCAKPFLLCRQWTHNGIA
jgi:hypothetical protein